MQDPSDRTQVRSELLQLPLSVSAGLNGIFMPMLENWARRTSVARYFLFATLLGAAHTGCSKIEKTVADRENQEELPLAEYRDTTVLDMYEGSRLSWILTTSYLVKWPHTDLVHARPVNLVVYDSLGAGMATVTADSGSVDEAANFLLATGNVHAISMRGVEITTDSLRWNKAANQISTEARVRVKSEEGDVLTGRGFISDADLNNWRILSEVKGIFVKPQDRVQKMEDAPQNSSQDGSQADSTGAAP